APERDPVRRAERLVCERLERHARTRAERLRPLVEQRAQARGLELGDERDRLPLRGAPEVRELVRDDLLRRVPGHGLERGAVAEARTGEPVRMVEPLERRLAPRAERALVDGGGGGSLGVLDAALAVVRVDAAAGRTRARPGGE